MVGPHPSGCRFLGQASGAVHAVRACCVPGTMLGAGDTSVSKEVKISVLVGQQPSWWQQRKESMQGNLLSQAVLSAKKKHKAR